MDTLKKKRTFKEVQQIVMITIGAIIAAVGLELFLVPNSILDGGVIGLSIIGAELTGFKMSLFIIILNLPFLFIGFRKIEDRKSTRLNSSHVKISYAVFCLKKKKKKKKRQLTMI